jgi:hypothetical protein
MSNGFKTDYADAKLPVSTPAAGMYCGIADATGELVADCCHPSVAERFVSALNRQAAAEKLAKAASVLLESPKALDGMNRLDLLAALHAYREASNA